MKFGVQFILDSEFFYISLHQLNIKQENDDGEKRK